jgi:hypothetical protein
LVRPDGSPFSWFSDTAWELFHRLTREEAAYYLEKRTEQSFTLIQALILAEFEGVFFWGLVHQNFPYLRSAILD